MPKQYDFSDFEEDKPSGYDFSDFEESPSDPMARALAGTGASGLAKSLGEGFKDAISGKNALDYETMVAAAKGDPEARAKVDQQSMNMAMAGVSGPASGATSVTGELGKAASSATQDLSKSIGSGAESLAARALGAERATVKRMGLDKVKEMGRYALDEGVVSPLAGAEDMAARNEVMKAIAGKKMGDVYGKIDEAGASSFNVPEVKARVSEELSPTYRTPINKGEWAQLDNTIESIAARGDGNIPLAEAQKLKEEIGSVAFPKGKRPIDPNPKQLMALDAYRIVNDAIEGATERGAAAVGSKELLSELKDAKKLYSNSKDAEELLRNRVSREQGNKLVGLTDWVSGGAGAAAGGAPGAVATAAGKKIAERYGSSTAAVALDKMSKLLASSPDKLGKFAGILQKAEKRGQQALYAVHGLLMKDPEYREQLEANP